MSRTLLTGVLAVSILMVAGCASTDPAPAEPEIRQLDFLDGPGPYSYECDAAEGDYRESNVAASGGKLRAAGMFQFTGQRVHPNWAPGVTIAFSGPASRQPSLGLQAFIMPDQPDTLQFAITGKGGAQERRVFASAPATDAWFPFEIRAARSGYLEVTIVGKSASIAAGPFEPARLKLFCSTAIVHFSKVTVENMP